MKKQLALSSSNGDSGSLPNTSCESRYQSSPVKESAATEKQILQLLSRKQRHPDKVQLMPPESPQSVPHSDISSLAGGFIMTIKRTTDLRYNLWWSFGLWLEDIPRRLGTNEALDRAVDTLTTAHSNFSCNRGPSVEALSKHSRALRTLSVYLDDRVHAQSSSTLSAVMILLICQLFLGPSNRKFSGHAEGAAAILKARKDFGPRDAFEAKLFLSMRGSVVRLISFSPIIPFSFLLFHSFFAGRPHACLLLHTPILTPTHSALRRHLQRQNKPYPRRMGQPSPKRLRQQHSRGPNAPKPLKGPKPNAARPRSPPHSHRHNLPPRRSLVNIPRLQNKPKHNEAPLRRK